MEMSVKLLTTLPSLLDQFTHLLGLVCVSVQCLSSFAQKNYLSSIGVSLEKGNYKCLN